MRVAARQTSSDSPSPTAHASSPVLALSTHAIGGAGATLRRASGVPADSAIRAVAPAPEESAHDFGRIPVHALTGVQDVLRSPGRPLDAAVRALLEPRFGQSFAHVRVHADGPAAASAAALGARAYAVGTHVVFGAGEFHPQDARGRSLLAHELAHVVQQQGAGSVPDDLRLEPARGAGEREAGAVAAAAAKGDALVAEPARRAPGVRRSARVQRQSRETAPSAAEDWDFSVADYQALRGRGALLRFAGDSAWLPARVRANILATLRYLYETAGRPALHMHGGAHAASPAGIGRIPFTGVSGRDLYHAHVVVQRGAMLDPTRAALQQRLVESRQRSEAVLGGGGVTDANRAAYTAAVGAAEHEATPLLESVARVDRHGDLVASLPGAAMIYHTLEVSAESMGVRAGDPRRNILTPFDDLTPRLYTPANPDSAEFRHEFDEVMVLGFLVDAAGVVHVHPGGLREQSLTTGRSEGDIDRVLEYFAPRAAPSAAPTAAGPERPPEFGVGMARPGTLVYVDDAAQPTRWSYHMEPGVSVPSQSFHELGRSPNFILVANRRFFLHPDRHVAP